MHQTRLLLIVVLISMSCTDIYHRPAAHNVPHFTGRNQKDINAVILPSVQYLQGGYSFTDNILGIINFKNYSLLESNKEWYNKELFVETGIGYYSQENEKTTTEIIATAGYGRLKFRDWNSTDGPSYAKEFSTYNSKFALQPSISTRWKWGQAILSSKLSNINFHKHEGRMLNDTLMFKSILLEKTSFFYLEPATTFRFGSGWARFQLQMQVSLPLGEKNVASFPAHLTAGFNFRFE
jgi:hypothetical protein